MKRDASALSTGRCDLLVVGGGVYGAWAAYDAALRGLSVVLVERGDWAEGTSSSSSKLIHGGLRYLEQFEFGLVRKSLAERRLLHRLAPHRIRPLRFAIPQSRGARVGRLRMKAGLWLYDRLASPDAAFPAHEWLSRDAFAARYPFIQAGAELGGFTYPDAGTDDFRMVLEVVAGALRAGATALNHVEATEWLTDGDRVRGARLRDRVGGTEHEVEADAIFHAAGPWTGELAPGERDAYRLAKGVHLLLPRLDTEDAFLLPSDADGRIVFLIPWYGRTMLGTTDTDYDGDPGALEVTDGEVDYLLTIAHRFLGVRWTPEQIVGRFAGVRTLPAADDDAPSSVSREWTLRESRPGLFTMVGGKYTSARADAAKVVDRVLGSLDRATGTAPSGERRLPWAPEGDFDDWFARTIAVGERRGFDAGAARTIALRHGTRAAAIFEGNPERIVPELALTHADLDHCARNEMAVEVEDVLRRRLPLTLVAGHDEAVLERCRASAADALVKKG